MGSTQTVLSFHAGDHGQDRSVELQSWTHKMGLMIPFSKGCGGDDTRYWGVHFFPPKRMYTTGAAWVALEIYR
jgi:hypothetical protein